MKKKELITLKHILKQAEIYKKESPKKFERKLKEYEALHGNKFKEIAKQTTLPSITSNNLAKSIGSTQEIFESIKSASLIFSKIKSSFSHIEKANSLIKAIKINFDSFNKIDWEKVNAYALIKELKAQGIDFKIIKDIDLGQLSELIKETRKIKLSLVKIIKDSSNFEDELNYEVLLSLITDIKTEIKNLKRKEMILHIAQDYLNNQNILIPESLTPREKDVFIEIMTGKSNQKISTILKISISTVEKHINSILRKTNYSDRKDLLVNYRS